MQSPTDSEILQFVSESNHIEGEPDQPGHPLFDDYVTICKYVINSRFPSQVRPLDIHKVLLRSQPWKFPGEIRQCGVSVGGSNKMNPELARVIYPLHIKEVDDRLLVDKYALPAQHVTDEESWDFHYAFETIHPFIDGNGRTGRLWLNAIRIQCGLPWITVMYNDRYQYYDAISEWEHLNGRTKWKLG